MDTTELIFEACVLLSKKTYHNGPMLWCSDDIGHIYTDFYATAHSFNIVGALFYCAGQKNLNGRTADGEKTSDMSTFSRYQDVLKASEAILDDNRPDWRHDLRETYTSYVGNPQGQQHVIYHTPVSYLNGPFGRELRTKYQAILVMVQALPPELFRIGDDGRISLLNPQPPRHNVDSYKPSMKVRRRRILPNFAGFIRSFLSVVFRAIPITGLIWLIVNRHKHNTAGWKLWGIWQGLSLAYIAIIFDILQI